MSIAVREHFLNQWAGEDLGKVFTFDLFDDSDGSDFDKDGTRSATITITKAGGGPLSTPVDGAAVVWADATNQITYPLVAANTDEVAQAYRGVITVVDGSVTHNLPFFFDVVPFAPIVVITDTDLEDEEPILAIDAYLPSGQTNWQEQINASYRVMARHIRNMGTRVPIIALDPQNMREMHLARALMHAFQTLWKAATEEDRFFAKMTHWEKRYEDEKVRFQDIRDDDLTGGAEKDSEQVGPRPTHGWESRG